eukprot:gene27168-2408_t
MASMMKSSIMQRSTASRPTLAPRRVSRATVVKPVAAVETAFIISASTASMLAVGRFVFLPYQRRTQNDAVVTAGAKNDGSKYFDNLQKDASFITTTNDPDGFNLIDVFGWGSLGHAIGFAILAISSLHDIGVNPWPAV